MNKHDKNFVILLLFLSSSSKGGQGETNEPTQAVSHVMPVIPSFFLSHLLSMFVLFFNLVP